LIDNEDIRKGLILNLKKGEKGAFREIFNLFGPKIYRFALAYLKNIPDAEELTQDVFLKIWEKREHLDPARNVKAYIFKIAINCIYDYIRKKNLERAFTSFLEHNFQPGVESSWNEVIWNDMLSKLSILVDKMPDQRRTIFLMSREEGKTNQMIAEKLNLSKRTVENQLYRATRFLKEKLGSEIVFTLLLLYLYFDL